MHKWILPTLSEILALSDSTLANCLNESTERTTAKTLAEQVEMPEGSTKLNSIERIKAETEWDGAIAALEQLLLQNLKLEIPSGSGRLPQGIVFASPVPVLNHPLLSNLPTWIFTSELPLQLPPATATALSGGQTVTTTEISSKVNSVLPLLPGDPLTREQFCLVLTKEFSLAIVLGEDVNGVPALLFSFEPEVIEQAWHFLRARVVLTNPLFPISELDALVAQFQPVAPHYRTVTQFSRLLLKYLPKVEEAKSEIEDSPSLVTPHTSHRPDVELLQAFAHEVRTPLTTIRTLTRLLLKRCDLATDVIKRLKIIDRECSEQIDRMELLFRAAELETSTIQQTSAQLTPMSLAQVLQQSIPKWQQSAARRNLTLDVILPQQLPTVVSDPVMLDRVLTGLIENFTRSLAAGSHIQVQVVPAGDQLKLQLLTQPHLGENGTAEELPVSPRKSLGQLLMFHPETGNISLNFAATKHLFQAIGGKLIVRQRPQQGEVLTIFLPMDVSPTDFYHRGKGTVSQPV